MSFEQFLQEKNLSDVIIKKLTNGGLTTMHMLKSINFDHEDWDEIAKELKLSAFDKLKVKSIIIPLQKQEPPPPAVDKEEKQATSRMKETIKEMETSLNLLRKTSNDIDLEINKHTKQLKSQFNKFHSLLNERQILLVKELKEIGITKQEKLKVAKDALSALLKTTKAKVRACTDKLIDPMNVGDIPKRKERILAAVHEIDTIKFIPPIDPVITDNKINIELDEKAILSAIHTFGSTSHGNVPVLVSLTDNNDATIRVGWKLGSSLVNNSGLMSKLRVGWVETNMDDTKNYNPRAFDEKRAKNKEFNLTSDDNDYVTINVKNKLQDYQFRLQHFNGTEWSPRSNVRSISVKKITDKLNAKLSGPHMKIVANSIIMNGNNQESSYLTHVIKTGVHHWKFRVDKYTFGNQMIGIWNTKYKSLNTETYIWDKAELDQLYGFGFHAADRDCHWVYTGLQRKKYGQYIKNGDIVEMIVDLNQLIISFKINKISGKGIDICAGSYRAGITLYGDQTKFTLLSYKPT